VRRIGVFMNLDAHDPQATICTAALEQGLRERGWNLSRTLQIDYLWGTGAANSYLKFAEGLVATKPDLVVATGGSIVGALQKTTLSIPIVFVYVTDPVGQGFADSLVRPGRNATGFTAFEYSIGAKWLELLKQVAPRLTPVAVIRDPGRTSAVGQFAAMQAVAPALGVELTPIDARDESELRRAISAFAGGSAGGLVATASGVVDVHRELVISLATRFRLPSIFSYHFYAAGGGLISYGPHRTDQYHQASEYVDRILRGEKPSDLPVQAPTKYETVLNMKTAKALGLDVPTSVLLRADEVVE
jgi:putative ABC transport system substrate-binding protein